LERYYLSDLKVKEKITTFRIICIDNLNKNRQYDLRLQYTLTILPCFLIPYSLVPVNLIFTSIQHYINSRISLKEAAILMNCSTSMSFKLYYLRCQKYIKDWIMVIIRLLLSINGACKEERIEEIKNNDNNTKNNWVSFKKYLDEYFNQLSKIPDSVMITHELKYPYIHNHFCHIQIGLGP